MDDTPETISMEEHTAAIAERDTKITNLEDAQSIIGSDGNFREGWMAKAGDDYADIIGTPLETKYSNPAGIYKAYESLQRMNGKSHVPDDTWDDSQVADFYESIGVPKDKEAYEVPKDIEGVPEGMERSAEMESGFMEFAHAHRIKPEDAQAALKWYYEQQGGQLEQLQKDAEEHQAAVTAELNETIGQKGMVMAKKAALALQDKIGGVDLMADPTVASNPNVIKLLNHIGANLLGEQNLPKLDAEITVTDAATEIDDIYANPNNPYHKGYQGLGTPAQNAKAQARMERLFAIKSRSA